MTQGAGERGSLVHQDEGGGGVGEGEVDDGVRGAVEGGFPPGVEDDAVRGPLKAG